MSQSGDTTIESHHPERLSISGRYTKAEIFQAYIRHGEPLSIRLKKFGLSVLFVLLFIAIIAYVTGDLLFSGALGVLMAIVLIYQLFWFGLRRRASKIALESSKQNKKRCITISDEGVACQTEFYNGETTGYLTPWSRVVKVKFDDSGAVIFMKPRMILPVPKRFFRSSEDWGRFLELLERYNRPDCPKILPPEKSESTEFASNFPHDTDAIHTHVSLKFSDLVEMMTSTHRGHFVIASASILLIALLIAGSLDLLDQLGAEEGPPIWVVLLILMAVFAGLYWVVSRLLVWLGACRDPDWKAPYEVTLHNTGVWTSKLLDHRSDQIAWSQFKSVWFTQHYLILSINKLHLILIPWRCFSNRTERSAARDLVFRHLGRCLGCHQPLCGTRAEACPECGKPIEPPRTWTMPAKK